MKRAFKILFRVACCLALVFVALRFGPSLYYRFFGSGNTLWISQRFSEELKEKNELVVFETVLTGSETAKLDAWLLGTVQEVVVPYSYSISFVVDLSRSRVSADGPILEVRLPAPKAGYSKLTVDEALMQKWDWLYPLSPERYAAIKLEIEAALFKEASEKPEYLDAAWRSAVKSMEGLFQTIAQQSAMGVTCEVLVVRDDSLPAAAPSPAPLPEASL